MQDKIFDSLAVKFGHKIYGTAKGAVRLTVLQRDLDDWVFAQAGKRPLRILDAGCGQGQFSLELARQGHELVLCEPSADMLEVARQAFQTLVQPNVQFVQSTIQNLSREEIGDFDLVLCHAVLEWLIEPSLVFDSLLKFVRPGGYLSLMFYNVNSIVFRNLVRGNFYKVLSQRYRGDENSLTPINPLEPNVVYNWFEEYGIAIIGKSGVRVFYDYMEKAMREQRTLEDIVAMELKFSRNPEFLALGRYIHVLGQKKK